ncbi:MAG TPA: TRAM domain-containing protein [Trebonia sp.]|nr:TRAM domain-containing protein [Trebonia sp.]
MGYQVGESVEVTAESVAQGGWCIGRPAGLPVLFVRHALPGERVVARVTEATSRFARADAVEILRPSPDRVRPPCPHARPGGCGGCDWQHASLPAQRALKAAVIGQQLRRLAGVDRAVTVEPLPGDAEPAYGNAGAVPSGANLPAGGEPAAGNEPAAGGEPAASGEITARSGTPGLGWRTRVQFAVRDDGAAGLRAHRSHEVIDVGDCLIAHPRIRELGIPRRRWPGTAAVEAVAGSPGPGGEPAERMVIVTPAGDAEPGGRPGAGAKAAGSRGRGGVGRFRSEDKGGTQEPTAVPAESVLRRARRRLTPVRGRAFLSQRAAGREWRVSAGAFWQVHPAAAGALAEAVLAATGPQAGDAVLDLYCGVGLFAGVVAPLVGPHGTVIGIESDQAAVRDARHNLRDWPWAQVRRGDVAQVLRRGGLPPARLAIADPPRAGLAREVVDYLSGTPATRRFAYVSCDPATLARDIGLLLARGWALEGLRAFDAFPMTHHVECVATLTR